MLFRSGTGAITFASEFPGKILELKLDGKNSFICQKDAFMCATTGVKLEMHFRKKVGAGFFGGEGFILQRLSGKGLAFGGSLVRTEATGYGCVYFAREVLQKHGNGLEGKVCAVSGAGNVSQYAVQKLLEFGAKVVTLSDRSGFIYDPEGLDEEKLDFIIDLKTNRRENLSKYAEEFGCEYHPDEKPWKVPCDLAFPCATQNEINEDDARTLLKNGCKLVSEGANMPTSCEGVRLFQEAKAMYCPGKAANAGGVAISGLEMTQNAMRLSWSREEVDLRLYNIMKSIHELCVFYGKDKDYINYLKGANIGGFVKVADAMLSYGVM